MFQSHKLSSFCFTFSNNHQCNFTKTNNIIIAGRNNFMFGVPCSHHCIGVIIISKIVISGFCPVHFTVTFAGDIEFSSLYREYCYNLLKIIISGFHYTYFFKDLMVFSHSTTCSQVINLPTHHENYCFARFCFWD